MLIFLGALGVLFALPGMAGATVFCVDTTPGVLVDNDSIDPSCEAPQPTILSGLAAAQNQAGPDSVLIGPGSYTLPSAPNASEVSYASEGVLHLRGIGNPHLTMGSTVGLQSGISIFAGNGSSVEGLSLTIPANADIAADWGLEIGGVGASVVLARDLHVDGPAASNAQGIELGTGGKLVDSTVKLPEVASPTNTAVIASSGDVTLLDDEITADVGITGSGNTVTVERSRITAWWGAQTDGGALVVRDSLIQVEKRNSAVGIKLANDNNSFSTILGTIENDTIVGGEGFNTAGIRVQADQTQETANATIADTVISGPAHALEVWSDAEREAKATVLYSNYDPAKVNINTNLDGSGTSGTSTYLPTSVTNLVPGFVDPVGGDFHLAAGSALIDGGDPAAPAIGALDRDGDARAIAGTCGAAARRDIGADEFDPGCAPAGGEGGGGAAGGSGEGIAGGGTGSIAASPVVPDTTIALRGKHRVTASGKSAKVTVAIGSTVAGASYRCRVDGKAWRACSATTTLRLKPGKHKVAAVAATAAGVDPTPAIVRVRVIEATEG
ncbi:MAG TPA: hypothetical protein VJL81_11085 [Solirubrobacterales bacterium]|nr:hypothetical protein [Solirubrobacterales bacterium]